MWNVSWCILPKSNQNILFQSLFTYKRRIRSCDSFLRETFQDLQNCHFSFNTIFPLNIILYQLSYSLGMWRFTIQQKKDVILHDLFRCWRWKSCVNSLIISLKRIIVINLGILSQSQSQVTATLLTKYWLTKKRRRCISPVHFLSNYRSITLEQIWGSFVPPLLVHCITKQIAPSIC